MTKALAWAFACLIALAPAINDICGLNCAQPVAASCPQHQGTPAPEKCSHDHTVLTADLSRPQAVAPTFQSLGIIATPALSAFRDLAIGLVTSTRCSNHAFDPIPLSIALRI